jgi:hypothetical protein
VILKIVVAANIRIRVGQAVEGNDQIMRFAGIVRCGNGRDQIALAAVHDNAGRNLSRRRLAATHRQARRPLATGGTADRG